MASTKIYTCDVCGIARQESNHWHLLKVDTDISSFGSSDIGATIRKWDDVLAADDRYKHLCGIGCSIKMLSSTAEGW